MTTTSRWNRVSRRPLADILDELRAASTLTFDDHGHGVVVMSVNRPHRANSQTIEMFGEIAWATAALRNAQLRALIITGAGGKAFCTGFDLDEVDVLTRMSVSEFTDLVETAASGSTGLRALPYPVIAAVSGPAACRWPWPPTSESPTTPPVSAPASCGSGCPSAGLARRGI